MDVNFINPAVNFEKEYVICAAIYFDDGKEHVHQPKNIHTGYVVSGRRHHNCFATLSVLGIRDIESKKTQGFLTSKDRFLDRHQSMEIAIACGQVKEDGNVGSPLFSEDLY